MKIASKLFHPRVSHFAPGKARKITSNFSPLRKPQQKKTEKKFCRRSSGDDNQKWFENIKKNFPFLDGSQNYDENRKKQ